MYRAELVQYSLICYKQPHCDLFGAIITSAKTILITGCSSGIGLFTTLGLRERGYRDICSCSPEHRRQTAKTGISFSLYHCRTCASFTKQITLCFLRNISEDQKRIAETISSHSAAFRQTLPISCQESNDISAFFYWVLVAGVICSYMRVISSIFLVMLSAVTNTVTGRPPDCRSR